MQVAEILKSKGSEVITAGPDEPLAAVIGTLRDKRIGAILVGGPGAAPAGIISERDIVHLVAERGPAALDLPVSSAMTAPVITCTSVTEVEELMETMLRERIRHLPVVDHDELRGIISIGDVVKSVVAELNWMKNALKDQVVQSAAWSTEED